MFSLFDLRFMLCSRDLVIHVLQGKQTLMYTAIGPLQELVT